VSASVALPEADVVVPVFDNADALERCLTSVRKWGGPDQQIVLLDDCSQKGETHALLARWSSDKNVTVIRNPENLGYTANVNQWLRSTNRDVVLLNSDTEVGPMWLHTLRRAVYSKDQMAAVSAVSDNAGAMSVPEKGTWNNWRAEGTWESSARAMLHRFSAETWEVPTIHGFCVYFRADALAEVGEFDEHTFRRGYGEENDWSMRARASGWELGIVPGVIVHHDQGGSFGSERGELIARSRELLNAKHPGYSASIRRWFSSVAYQEMVASIRQVHRGLGASTPRRRVLYVLHNSGGGTPETNLDLMERLSRVQESFVLLVRTTRVELHRFGGNRRLVPVLDWEPREPFKVDKPWVEEYGQFIADVLDHYAIEIVHIRHLINQPLLTVPRAVKARRLRLILSTHDFYYICPSVNLLDNRMEFCGGVCTPGQGKCYLPNDFVAAAPDLKHQWVNTWQKMSEELIALSDQIVVTTPSAQSVYESVFPDMAGKVIQIEHGRDGSDVATRARLGARKPGPLRILCPANWAPHKGPTLISDLAKMTAPLVEWHILGNRSDLVRGDVVHHSGYRRDQFEEIVSTIDPDFIGLFSIWPETYSHTLSEAWAAGVPVLATELGAVGDRIKAHGGGQTFEHGRPAKIAQYVLEQARRVLSEATGADRQQPRDFAVRSLGSMASDYDAIYHGEGAREMAPRIGFLPSNGRGSSHVRVLAPAASASHHELAVARQLDIGEVLSGRLRRDCDVVLVQRDAVSANYAHEFATRVREAGADLVVDLDDDLLSDSASIPIAVRDAVRALASRAHRAVVSTEPLAQAISGWADQVTVVANAIDDPPWSYEPRLPRAPIRAFRRAKSRWVYWGTRSHQDELEWLKDVMANLRDHEGRRIELDVVGVASHRSPWFTQLEVPDDDQEYVRFARWMRRASQERNWVGALAPLLDNPFNSSKSDIKILESRALGLPVIAADVGPYRDWREAPGAVQTVPMDVTLWRSAISRTVPAPLRESAEKLPSRSVWSRDYAQRWVSALTDRR